MVRSMIVAGGCQVILVSLTMRVFQSVVLSALSLLGWGSGLAGQTILVPGVPIPEGVPAGAISSNMPYGTPAPVPVVSAPMGYVIGPGGATIVPDPGLAATGVPVAAAPDLKPGGRDPSVVQVAEITAEDLALKSEGRMGDPEKVRLADVRVYDGYGNRLYDDATIRRSLTPGSYILAADSDQPIDPAFLKAVGPAVSLVVIPARESSHRYGSRVVAREMASPPSSPIVTGFDPKTGETSMPDLAEPTAAAPAPSGSDPKVVAPPPPPIHFPRLGICDGETPEGKLRMKYVRWPFHSKGWKMTPSGYKSLPYDYEKVVLQADYPAETVHFYDRDGRRVTDLDRIRKLFPGPGLVLLGHQGYTIDPKLLQIAAPGVIYVALPVFKTAAEFSPKLETLAEEPRPVGAMMAVTAPSKVVPLPLKRTVPPAPSQPTPPKPKAEDQPPATPSPAPDGEK
jgi:hypothetical protein